MFSITLKREDLILIKKIKLDFLSAIKNIRGNKEIFIPSAFRVGDLLIKDLKPLGGIFKPGVTKAGRLSFSGILNDNRKVKVYESFNHNQIKLRKELGKEFKNNNILFPKIIAHDKNFIIEEWVEGKTFEKINISKRKTYSLELIKFLKKLQFDKKFIDLAKNNNKSFCYLSDYLLKRLKPWAQWLPVENLINEWLISDEQTKNIIEKKISHPDLSLSNLIESSKNKKIYIVDNELIGVGKGWLLDERNSYFRNKLKNQKLEPLISRFYDLSWKMRLVGSAIDNGQFMRAKRMANIELN